MIKHSKGPWRAVAHNSPTISEMGRCDDWNIFDADGKTICIEHRKFDCIAADVQLIAAAPDLLEALDPDALEAIADELTEFKHGARAHALRAMAKKQRTAIAKATGVKS